MKTLITVLIVIEIFHSCYAPPVTKTEKEHAEVDPDPLNFIPYSQYLKQVVVVLEADPGFKKKLEEASEDDIKSGKIAHELDFVSHHIRTRLDELKRVELDRLLDIRRKLTEHELNENEIIGDPLHRHLDHSNKDTFEIEDLKKLITKTTEDLAEADRMRREEFKQYELQKEFERQEKLNHTNGSQEREKLEKHYKEMEEKHKKHEPLHEPGHKAQLEEVWREQDHMQNQFDPRTFFAMHDIDSNRFWDQDEVKAVFLRELNKLYEAGAPEDDLHERQEEMERMREAVFAEMDRDKDGLISEKEFIDQTKRNEFEQDHGWKGIDEQGRQYTDEEMQEFVRQQQMLHPPPAYHAPPGGGYAPPPGNYHPNQIPQGYPQQPPPQYYQGQQYQQPQYQQPPPQHSQNYPQQNQVPPIQQYQQPIQGQLPNQPVPPVQQYQQPPVPQVNQPPPQNQPSPQVNPQSNTNQQNVNQQNAHESGKSVQAP